MADRILAVHGSRSARVNSKEGEKMVKTISVLLATFCVMMVYGVARGGDFEKVKLGLVSGFGVSANTAARSPGSSLGVFVNFTLSRRFVFDMKVEKTGEKVSSACTAHDGCFFESAHERDWSTRLAVNYHFKTVSRSISPFVGIGTGNYYIQNSKRRIKQSRRDPGSESVDYDFRRYYKRPGFFATLGMKWQANNRTSIYLQTKSSLLFDRENDLLVGSTSKFTDLLNVSASLRLNLN